MPLSEIIPLVLLLFGSFDYTFVVANPFFKTYVDADTLQGRVKGTKGTSRIGNKFCQFKGIPYAQPPLGDLRFEPPLPHPGWSGVKYATEFGAECLQIGLITRAPKGSEDCLYLNVYTRKAYTKDATGEKNLHPVIVFIHGGLFMSGSSNIYKPKYFMDEDVVLVTLNYRLASLGFLNTGNGLINGNMGLKDQALALEWVQKNIEFFNGDPNKVTIMGQSAGSVCTHLHTLSPLSQGRFAQAISLSGTALSPWGLVSKPKEQSLEFATALNCPTDNPDAMVKCLKGLPASEIVSYHKGYIKAATEKKLSLFGPSVETSNNNLAFLPAHPLELLKQGKVSSTPWIAGVTSGDGLVHLIPLLHDKEMTNKVNSNWNELVPTLLGYQHLSTDQQNNVSQDALKYYLDNKPISRETTKEAMNMVSDSNFFLDIHDASILQSKVAPTYIYYYTYDGLFSLANFLFSDTVIPMPGDFDLGGAFNWAVANWLQQKQENNLGICHGDEVPLLFNVPLIRKEVGWLDRDYEFSRGFVRLWTTFALLGYPSIPSQQGGVKWEKVTDYNPKLEDIQLKMLNIDNEFKMIDEPYYTGITFWKNHSISSL